MSKVHWTERHKDLIRDLSKRGIAPEPVLRYSLLSSACLNAIIRACDAIKDLPGKTAEIGCASGGTSRMISLICGRQHFACDTFEGLVDAGEVDTDLENGYFKNKETELCSVIDRLKDIPNITIVQGIFPQSATDEMDEFALVHIDVDTYRSMTDCFGYFASRIKVGGFIILDDVIGRHCTRGGARFWSELDLSNFTVVEQNDPQAVLQRIR
jgi:hypothetical protein